jgi:MATE family multidrug resistance protein
MLINGAVYWGVGFTTAYLLAFVLAWEARGIWFGLTSALCIAAVMLTLRFRHVIGRHVVQGAT